MKAAVPSPSRGFPEPQITGRPAPGISIERHSGIVLLCAASLVLKSLIFAPIDCWPLAFVCLVPWLVFVGGAVQAPRVYFYSYVWGLAFFLINMRWLYPATGIGYIALSLYQAAYFPLVACPVRHVIRRRRWPLALAFPLVWTGSEILRAVVMSGFPWFFLSHSLHGVLTLIQISDLTGAYGVGFLVAAVNGAVADLVFARLESRAAPDVTVAPPRRRRAVVGAAFAVIALLATCVYGQIRLRGEPLSDGPRIAVLQGDYVMTVDGEEADDDKKKADYFSMLQAASSRKPDLYLLPETPWIMYLNPEARGFFKEYLRSFEALQRRATLDSAYVVTGSASLERTPYDLLATERRYNSAFVFRPEGGEPDRYDKVHLVYFGEVVPFRYGRLRFLYFWLNRLMPFSGPEGTFEYSLVHGDGFHVFPMQPTSQPERTFRFGIPICYEDVMPYVSREFAYGSLTEKKVDFLLNISNDGWFGRGIQQPQHLAICAFRAIENRVGIARAVNTGVSAFIDPLGRVYGRVKGDPKGPWPRETGFSVENVRVDSRYTPYSRYGDWFAWGCALMWLILYVDYWVARARLLIED